ncbi:hypothetical protein N7G274_005153 [Stereocaulon virgatum]|uniref:Uncharacterized protein n=1 Tax=Stereocaulon virgatum TaxID=373712 RepID=A0ABR4A911_9LECA
MDSESKSSAQSNLHPDAGKIYLEYMRRMHSHEETHLARANELSKRPLTDDELKSHLRRKETLDRWRADELEKNRRSEEKRAKEAQAAKRLKSHEAERFRMVNQAAELSGLRNHISASDARSLDLTNASDRPPLKQETPTTMAAVSQDHDSKPKICMYAGRTRGTYPPATTPVMNPSSSPAEQADVNFHPTAGHVLRSYILAKNLHLAPHHLKLINEFARRPLTATEYHDHLERVRFLEEHERQRTLYVGSTQQQGRYRLMQANQQQLEKQQRQEQQHQQQQQAKSFLPMITPSLSPNHPATGYRGDAPDSCLPTFPYTVESRKLHPLMTMAGDPVGHGNRRPLCPALSYNDNGAYIGAPNSPASCQTPLTSGKDTAAVSVSQDHIDIDEYMGHQCKSITTQSLWSPEAVVSTPALPTAEVENESKPALWGNITGPCKPEPPLSTPAPTLASEDQSQVSTPSNDSVKKSTLRPADSLASDLPTAGKKTTTSLSRTVKDLFAFKAMNPAKNSSSLLSNASIEATVDSASTSRKEAIEDDSDNTAATQKNYPVTEDVCSGMLASGLRLNSPDLPWRSFECPGSFFVLPPSVENYPAPFSWGISKAGEERQLPSDEEIRKALNREQELIAANKKQGPEVTNASITGVECDTPIAEISSPKLIAIWHERAEIGGRNCSLRYLAQAEQARTANVEKEQPRQSQDEVTKATIQEQNKENAEAGINVTKVARPQNSTEVTPSVNKNSADGLMHAEAETKDDDKARRDARNGIDRDTKFPFIDASFHTQRTQDVPLSAKYHSSSAKYQHGFPQPFVQSRSTNQRMHPALPVRPKVSKTKKEYSVRVEPAEWWPSANGKPYEWYKCAKEEPSDIYRSAKGQPFDGYEPFLPENGEDKKSEVKAKTVPANQKSMLGSTKERSARFKGEAEREAGQLRFANCNLEQGKSESCRTQQSHSKQVNADEDCYRKWQAANKARDEKDEAHVQQERQARYETMKQQKSTPQQLTLKGQQEMMAVLAEKIEAQREQEQRNHVPVTEQQETAKQELDGMHPQKKVASNALAQPFAPHPNRLKDWARGTDLDSSPIFTISRRMQQHLARNNDVACDSVYGSRAYLQQQKEDEERVQTSEGATKPVESACEDLAELEKAQQEPEQPDPELQAISERMAYATGAMRRSLQLLRDATEYTPQKKAQVRERIEVEYKMRITYLMQRRRILSDPIARLEEWKRTKPVDLLPENDRTTFDLISKAAHITPSVQPSLSEVHDNTSAEEIGKSQIRIQNAEAENQGGSISWDREIPGERYDDTGKKVSLRAEPKRTLQQHKDDTEQIAKKMVEANTEQISDVYDVSDSESESDEWFEAKEGNEVKTEQGSKEAESTSNGDDFERMSQVSREDVVSVEDPASGGGEIHTEYSKQLAKLEADNKKWLRLFRAKAVGKVAVFEGDDTIVNVEVKKEEVEEEGEEEVDDEVMEDVIDEGVEDDEWETLSLDEAQGSDGRCGGAWW